MSLDAIDLALGDPSCSWREAALGQAQKMARAMPLVRVVVPSPDGGKLEVLERHEKQLVDVFRDGILRVDHESDGSREKEDKLGAARSLYFHAGRTHPIYGTAVFVLLEEHGQALEASPFGLGALLCEQGQTGDERVHDPGCLAPASHDDIDDQKRLYETNAWRDPWRVKFKTFLASYFGKASIDRYFAYDVAGRPDLAGPRAIYQNPRQKDWRAWTVEVRATETFDLNKALDDGRLLAWALSRRCRMAIADGIENKRQTFPFFDRLNASKENKFLAGDTEDPRTLFTQVDFWVRELVS